MGLFEQLMVIVFIQAVDWATTVVNLNADRQLNLVEENKRVQRYIDRYGLGRGVGMIKIQGTLALALVLVGVSSVEEYLPAVFGLGNGTIIFWVIVGVSIPVIPYNLYNGWRARRRLKP